MTVQSKEPKALGWDDPITNDGEAGFTLLNEGDYIFRVETVLRMFSQKHDCPQAEVKLLILGDGVHSTMKESFLLRSDLEWKIAAFFRSIGLKKHGQPYVMDWNAAVGRLGKAHVVQDSFVGREGKDIKVNKIKRYYDADENNVAAPAAAEAEQEDMPF